MSKNTFTDQKQNHKLNSHEKLRRRPIHEERQYENRKEEYSDGLNDSPQKSEKLYPDLSFEDDVNNKEFEEHELNHRDGMLNNAKLQKGKGFEKEKKKQKENNEASSRDISTAEPTSYSKYLTYFIYIILSSLLLLFVSFFSSSKPATKLSLNEILKNMKGEFHDQNEMTFLILKNSLDKVVNVNEEPSAPAIFTVTVNKNALHRSHEFSRYLADALAPQSIVSINESIWQNNPDDIKLKIDNEIKSVAQRKGLFFVIVDNLQNIPLKGAMIFHSYCDHELAPFKRAVFLFIIPLDINLPGDASIKDVDGAAFKQLKKIWNNASPDEVDSLITRITVNVINIS